jgi:hypothetical protein
VGGTSESSEGWLVDSGATHHMCHTKSQLRKLRKSSKIRHVVLGNSTRSVVDSVGTADLQLGGSKPCITLNEVLFVPNLRSNLLSVT